MGSYVGDKANTSEGFGGAHSSVFEELRQRATKSTSMQEPASLLLEVCFNSQLKEVFLCVFLEKKGEPSVHSPWRQEEIQGWGCAVFALCFILILQLCVILSRRPEIFPDV
jgi:hypothetical protein